MSILKNSNQSFSFLLQINLVEVEFFQLELFQSMNSHQVLINFILDGRISQEARLGGDKFCFEKSLFF